MMQGMQGGIFARASGSNAKGRFRRNRITVSDGADNSSVASISAAPNTSRLAQRRMLATASRASNRFVVVKPQALPQRQRPDRIVRLRQMPFQHLRLHAVGIVEPVQRVQTR